MKIDESPQRRRGRPREFDRSDALARALTLFWQRGYEGTSIADLVAAMEITPPALYAAFGSKEALYRETLSAYRAGRGDFIPKALQEERTAYAALARVLREAAAAFTAGDDPTGCMISTSVLACAPEHQPVAEVLAAMRAETIRAMTERIGRGIEVGEVPSSVDAAALGRFYGAVVQGMSVQARDGADEAALLEVAAAALAAWPAPCGLARC